MPLVSLTELLRDAQKRKYAVGSFNIVTLEMLSGVLSAAEAVNSPVIIGLAARHVGVVDPWLIAGAVLAGAKKAQVPVVFHFDHAESFESALLGIQIGCNSVMIDGSKLPLEKNIELTESVVTYGHSKAVAVEGELGGVGGTEGEIEGGTASRAFTNPAEAHDFVFRTNADALAVGIGTVHGLYKGSPDLQLGLLEAISRSIAVPLVLHGGTGLSEDEFRRTIDRGICKINVFTELALACSEGLRANFEKNPNPISIATVLGGISAHIENIATSLMKSFRSAGKA